MRIIDLSQTFVHDMQVYPGDTPPSIVRTHDIAHDGFTNHQLTTGMHAGTHIDGTWHMIDNRTLIDDVPLDTFIGKACVIDIRDIKVFSDTEMVLKKAEGCSIVLFYTGYGEKFGTGDYLYNYPLIDQEVAKVLVNIGVKLVGVDSFSPDVEPYGTHKILLGNNVLIAENLSNLHLLLAETNFEVLALPLKIAADSAPARIIALIK